MSAANQRNTLQFASASLSGCAGSRRERQPDIRETPEVCAHPRLSKCKFCTLKWHFEVEDFDLRPQTLPGLRAGSGRGAWRYRGGGALYIEACFCAAAYRNPPEIEHGFRRTIVYARCVSFPFCFHGENHFCLRCWLFCFSGRCFHRPVYSAYNSIKFVDSQ